MNFLSAFNGSGGTTSSPLTINFGTVTTGDLLLPAVYEQATTDRITAISDTQGIFSLANSVTAAVPSSIGVMRIFWGLATSSTGETASITFDTTGTPRLFGAYGRYNGVTATKEAQANTTLFTNPNSCTINCPTAGDLIFVLWARNGGGSNWSSLGIQTARTTVTGAQTLVCDVLSASSGNSTLQATLSASNPGCLGLAFLAPVVTGGSIRPLIGVGV